MKAKINDRAREVCFDGVFYQTGIELEIPTSVALRMSKIINVTLDKVSKKEYNPDLFKKYKRFGITTHVDSVSGWGNVSYNLLKYSSDYNISLIGRTYEINDPLIWRFSKGDVDESMAMIWHEQPLDNWKDSPFAKNIAIIPWETTKIPDSWVPRINSFDALFTTCEENRKAFKNSGVTIPIEVIHWGHEPELWPYIERPERDIFTFGTMGALSIRKGTDILIDAFREAFPPDVKDVRLICKTSYNQYPFMVKDPRIIVQMTPVTHQELLSTFFKEIDCFVFPTRGEGWGMTPHEAMSTGIPAIVTNWSGPVEYMSRDDGFLLDYTMSPATDFTKNIYKQDCGEWAEPSKEQLKEYMIWCYNNRNKVKEMGKKASERINKDFTWEKQIKTFHDALKKYL